MGRKVSAGMGLSSNRGDVELRRRLNKRRRRNRVYWGRSEGPVSSRQGMQICPAIWSPTSWSKPWRMKQRSSQSLSWQLLKQCFGKTAVPVRWSLKWPCGQTTQGRRRNRWFLSWFHELRGNMPRRSESYCKKRFIAKMCLGCHICTSYGTLSQVFVRINLLHSEPKRNCGGSSL